jgi:catechol 2,3-dioxygenase-like lactoylglutathione lyase family enzyme
VSDPTGEDPAMNWTLEVVVVPVSDISRSIEFYRDQVGFKLDHYTQNEHMNVAQLTLSGSGCSIVFGDREPAES